MTELILESYLIDRERVLVTGYSMGGGGTWHMAANHQDIFTAAMPMAALPLSNSAEIDWQIPILVLNGTEDELFDFVRAENEALAVKEAGANLNFVPVQGVAHYDVNRFVGHIQDSLPWLMEQWAAE